jgi:hypothetical protein
MSHEESSENLKAGGPEGELPRELKAVEAELATLRPRDRLDRERLIFLAGQASVGPPTAARRATAAGWAWPVSLAGMTALAATLLVMLLVRPEPQVVERVRIVRVPVEPHVSESPRPSGHAGTGTGSSASPQRPASHAHPAMRDFASSSTGPRPQPGWSRFGSRAEYLEMFERMLAQGVDPWRHPLPASARGDERADAPLPYREWLKTMLDDHSGAES